LFENSDFTNCKLPIRKGRLEKGILGRTVLFTFPHEPSLHPYTPATWRSTSRRSIGPRSGALIPGIMDLQMSPQAIDAFSAARCGLLAKFADERVKILILTAPYSQFWHQLLLIDTDDGIRWCEDLPNSSIATATSREILQSGSLCHTFFL
jgi:hypothetical protein